MKAYYRFLKMVMIVGLCCGIILTVNISSVFAAAPTQAPTPTPIPTWTPVPGAKVITLKANGKGDYPDLASAVNAAPPGATIRLEKGNYKLEKSLHITKAITLIGAGMDETVISGGDGDRLIHFDGEGPFNAQFLTFKVENNTRRDVVVVADGEVNFEECRLTGSNLEDGEWRGVGLTLINTKGMIHHCAFDRNVIGLLLKSANPTVKTSLFTKNSSGIDIRDDSQPLVEENTITGNKEWGIRFASNAGGIISKNVVTGNLRAGILVNGDARPTLAENICSKNKEAGIYYWDNASGVAQKNRCTENKGSGIIVAQNAHPLLKENDLSKNKEHGIYYSDDAGGTARKNLCTQNTNGIWVTSRAKPKLEQNTCSKNARYGIVFEDRSSGTASQNECSENKRAGIFVRDYAQPELRENICSKNGAEGIRFEDETGGKVVKNVCNENLFGIVVVKPANPQLVDNITENNRRVELDDVRVTAVTPTVQVAVAQATNTPISSITGPTQTPAPGKKAISLKADGRGDYPDLPSAIRAAADGAVITLEAGVYILKEPLSIQKPTTLLGAGMDKTVIQSDTKGFVIRFNTSGLFKVQGITFKHEGEKVANVVEVEKGEVDIQECRFIGGMIGSEMLGCFNKAAGWDPRLCRFVKDQTAGTGLALGDGKVTGKVSASEGSNNQYASIAVYGEAEVTLEGNKLQRGNFGVAFWGTTTSVVRKNILTGNDANGLLAGDKAKLTIEENEINENSVAGIGLIEDAGGMIRKNQFKYNDWVGIYVMGNSRPAIEENTFDCSSYSGCMRYHGNAGGTARKNNFKSSGNSIDVYANASPVLEENVCYSLATRGILFGSGSSGAARNNQCTVKNYTSRKVEIQNNQPSIAVFATPTPLPDLTILYNQDFENSEAKGWYVYKGDWKVIEADGRKVYYGKGPENYPQIWIEDTIGNEWKNYAFETRLRVLKGGVQVCSRSFGGNFYNAFLSTDGTILLNKLINREYKTVLETKWEIKPITWYTVRIEVFEHIMRLYIDDTLIASHIFGDEDYLTQGTVGYYIGGGDQLQIDDVKVWTISK